MKERSLLISIGILIYVVTSIVNRFVYEIPDYIYIPIVIIGLLLMIIGYIRNKVRNNW